MLSRCLAQVVFTVKFVLAKTVQLGPYDCTISLIAAVFRSSLPVLDSRRRKLFLLIEHESLTTHSMPKCMRATKSRAGGGGGPAFGYITGIGLLRCSLLGFPMPDGDTTHRQRSSIRAELVLFHARLVKGGDAIVVLGRTHLDLTFRRQTSIAILLKHHATNHSGTRWCGRAYRPVRESTVVAVNYDEGDVAAFTVSVGAHAHMPPVDLPEELAVTVGGGSRSLQYQLGLKSGAPSVVLNGIPGGLQAEIGT